MTEAQAIEISRWKYEDEYKIYNLYDWDTMVYEGYSLCDEFKRKRFISYTNESDELIGFTNILDEEESIFFGIGVSPKYLNKGIGKQITKSAIEECKIKYGKKPVLLDVRTWNNRAVNCYKSQGFEIVDKKIQETYIGIGEFYVMKYFD